MITSKILEGKTIYLRQVEERDCTDNYVAWLNNHDVNQHLETKWSEQNLESIKSFVKDQRENAHSYLFAIICKENDTHIGNIKIGPIHSHDHHADISYFIGDVNYWNKGIATEAIALICKFGFDDLALHRIEAGTYSCAIGSWKALEKCGFKREGIFREQVFFNGKYIDMYRYGLLGSELNEATVK